MKTLKILTMIMFVLALGIGNVFAGTIDNGGGGGVITMLPLAYNSGSDKLLAPVKADIHAETFTFERAFKDIPSSIGGEKATQVPAYCLSNWQCVFK